MVAISQRRNAWSTCSAASRRNVPETPARIVSSAFDVAVSVTVVSPLGSQTSEASATKPFRFGSVASR